MIECICVGGMCLSLGGWGMCLSLGGLGLMAVYALIDGVVELVSFMRYPMDINGGGGL